MISKGKSGVGCGLVGSSELVIKSLYPNIIRKNYRKHKIALACSNKKSDDSWTGFGWTKNTRWQKCSRRLELAAAYLSSAKNISTKCAHLHVRMSSWWKDLQHYYENVKPYEQLARPPRIIELWPMIIHPYLYPYKNPVNHKHT